jgi:TonB family protein
LKEDLLARAEELVCVSQVANTDFPQLGSQPMPTLTERPFSVLPADPRSLFFSFLSHAAAVVLIASGFWLSGRPIVKTSTLMRDLTYVPMPLGQDAPHGGGSGGDRSTIQVSRGTPPKFSNMQVTPPVIVVRNPSPKLQVDPTVLGPPQIKLPQSNQLGDLTSPNVVIPSNGTGGRGGMGSTLGTGIGDGMGAGVGPGNEAGIGGGLFHPGNGVSAPRAIYDPDPDYSDEARKAKYQGTVVLSLIVDPSGRTRNIRIARSLGMGLDQKAMEAVQKWQFAPGMKDGHAVAVQVNVEVNFRLY